MKVVRSKFQPFVVGYIIQQLDIFKMPRVAKQYIFTTTLRYERKNGHAKRFVKGPHELYFLELLLACVPR